MALRKIPDSELEGESDYQRWWFEEQPRTWEAEQQEEEKP